MGEKPLWEISRDIIIKAEEVTDPNLGCAPENRSIQKHIKYGVIVIDKTPGPTSHEIVAWIKKIIELDKAGHGGTLDPKVTGVLPITLQEATKVVQALLVAGKEYVCVMRTHREQEEQNVIKTIKLFEGKIFQRPPIRSSVKRRLRIRTIYRICFLEGDGRNWLLKIACESGTYIRKLCYDIGEILGIGAHMHELRRTRSGPYVEDDVVNMYDLIDAIDIWKENENETPLRQLIKPMESALSLLPKIWVRDSAVDALCTGAALAMPGILRFESGIEKGSILSVLTHKEEGIALMKSEVTSESILESERGIAATPIRVLMPRGTYPKMW